MPSRLVRGYFGEHGRVYVEARLTIHRQSGFVEEPLSLVIDTGATCTTLMPNDCINLGLQSYHYEDHEIPIKGIEGVGVPRKRAMADITFETEDGLEIIHPFEISLLFPEACPSNLQSAIGFDILRLAKLTIDPNPAKLEVLLEFDESVKYRLHTHLMLQTPSDC